jgi:hypothetical protein
MASKGVVGMQPDTITALKFLRAAGHLRGRRCDEIAETVKTSFVVEGLGRPNAPKGG